MIIDHLLIPILPLVSAVFSGCFGNLITLKLCHRVAIVFLAISTFLSFSILVDVYHGSIYEYTLFEWAEIGNLKFEIGFLIDRLSAIMMCVVTFVSLMVHIYTIEYMKNDAGYRRFFSYISLFTFAMLMLVMSNNFLQLFFGWEAVGLVSYLLIGFWYKKESAIYANLKAFLVNRIGDLGFLLGIGLIVVYCGSLNYREVFEFVPSLAGEFYTINEGFSIPLLAITCICLFIGAMGKSAQFPLHVWLPDSMEGPTPISALIHAATMVTAGIFMVARLSPIFEFSEVALMFILMIGSITAFFMGILGMMQNDIKKIVAYSTLSQLGYMTVALGASAYSFAIFHLVTHAFFKALLFLAAGSVIIGMHHEQDIRKMGGLIKYMPVTWFLTFIGCLSLAGMPFFSGFYSKDLIIEAVKNNESWISTYIYWVLNIGVFITAFYSFRLLLVVFHGTPKFDVEKFKPKESNLIVLLPLVLLAIPSILIGSLLFSPFLNNDILRDEIFVLAGKVILDSGVMAINDSISFAMNGFLSKPFFFGFAGFLFAYIFSFLLPNFGTRFSSKFPFIMMVLKEKYFLDKFNEYFFAKGALNLGRKFFKYSEILFIDGILVNGTAFIANRAANFMRVFQSGFLFHYAIVMIISVVMFFWWFIPSPSG